MRTRWNNTRETIDGEFHRVWLHDTMILEERFLDGIITLRAGRWRTATTKRRMNQYLKNWRVEQKYFVWWVTDVRGGSRGMSCLFVDGIILCLDGSVTYPDGAFL